MPLILAIEPDRRQTTKLQILARNQLHAELLIADTVEQALVVLDECDPELILTSPQLPARDQVALAARLRELAEDGLRVQTLTLPMLGVPGQRARIPQKGASGARTGRARASTGEGVDPVAFGMQVSALIERAGSERAAVPVGRPAVAHAVSAPHAVPASHAAPARAVEPGAVPAEATTTAVPRSSASEHPDWSDVLSAIEREIESVRREPLHAVADVEPEDIAFLASALARDLAKPTDPAPTAVPPQRASAATQAPPHAVAAPASADPAATPAPNPPAAAPPIRTKRIRRVPPRDEFGFYDPRQCGLSALIAKVNAKGDGDKPAPKKPA